MIGSHTRSRPQPIRRYRLTISYDGTAYSGWQIQPQYRTIQGEIEKALCSILGKRTIRVFGSGRTDAGVHARAQVAHFDTELLSDLKKIMHSLNAVLPDDIRIMHIRRMPFSFHARKSVKKKEYRYFIWNGEVVPPFIFQYRYHVPQPLHIDGMRMAARILEGHHDFSAFSANPNRKVKSRVREVDKLLIRRVGAQIEIVVRGNGFLYKMVRSIAGFLVRVGLGDVAPEKAREILSSKSRTAIVPTAPAHGLFLWRIYY